MGSPLSVIIRLMSSPEILFDVSPHVFSPPPNVHSSVIQFKFDKGDFILHDDQVLTANIAFKKPYVERICREKGFEIEAQYGGWWAGRSRAESVDFQDVWILRKK